MNELNLTGHRERASVWGRRGWNGTDAPAFRRWLIGGAGVALILKGLRRRGAGGPLLAAAGSTLAWWALGSGPERATVRGWATKLRQRLPWYCEDIVSDASADSFPASDPPAFTSVVGTAVYRRPR